MPVDELPADDPIFMLTQCLSTNGLIDLLASYVDDLHRDPRMATDDALRSYALGCVTLATHELRRRVHAAHQTNPAA